MRRLRKVFVISTAVVLALGFMAEAASADTMSDEAKFLQLINQDRAANGLGALIWMPQLVDSSRAHSADMAAQGTIFHTANLGAIPGNWSMLGENVGMGGSVEALHQAFMNSPHHRDNILGDYDHMGIGIVMGGSTIFVTEQFWKTAPVRTAVRARVARRVVHRRVVRRRVVRRRVIHRRVILRRNV